jgi:hypothetical protein
MFFGPRSEFFELMFDKLPPPAVASNQAAGGDNRDQRRRQIFRLMDDSVAE